MKKAEKNLRKAAKTAQKAHGISLKQALSVLSQARTAQKAAAVTPRSVLWTIYKIASTRDTLITSLFHAQDYGLTDEAKVIGELIASMNAKITVAAKSADLDFGGGCGAESVKNAIKALDALEQLGQVAAARSGAR